ncbi:MAG: hypothetical protein HGA23_11880, partial [Bacteroidales bacterium]|nr:hypothetical protein [Bacteroidales bacterium]
RLSTSATGQALEDTDAVEERVSVSGGPLKEHHHRRALRDKRLLPKVKSPARVIGLNRAQMGMTVNKPFLQILIGLTGLGLGYVEYLILHPDPLSEDPSLQQIWLPALILFIFIRKKEHIM